MKRKDQEEEIDDPEFEINDAPMDENEEDEADEEIEGTEPIEPAEEVKEGEKEAEVDMDTNSEAAKLLGTAFLSDSEEEVRSECPNF